MRRYAGYQTAKTNTTSTTVPQWSLVGAATFRIQLYDILVGADATPADNYAEFSLKRNTSNGTAGSTFTPIALDPGDPASLATFITNQNGTPTLTASSEMLGITLNQRATFRWVAVPDGEIIVPATAANGLSLMAVGSNATGTYNWTCHWKE